MGSSIPVRISEASVADVDAFARFLNEVWAEAGPDAPGFAGVTDDVMTELTARDAMLDRFEDPDRDVFLAREGDRVVGFAATRVLGEEAVELAGIIVAPSAEGRGVGAALVEAARRRAVANGHSTMIVRTETSNERALAFYRHRGFTPVRTTVENVEGLAVDVSELEARIT